MGRVADLAARPTSPPWFLEGARVKGAWCIHTAIPAARELGAKPNAARIKGEVQRSYGTDAVVGKWYFPRAACFRQIASGQARPASEGSEATVNVVSEA